MLDYLNKLREDVDTLSSVATAVDDGFEKHAQDASSHMQHALKELEKAEPLIQQIKDGHGGELPTDDMMGIGMVEGDPNDVEKLEWFLRYALVVHAKLTGDDAYEDLPGDPNSTIQTERMSRFEYLRDCANSEIPFAYRQLDKYPEDFNIPGYKRRLDVIIPALVAAHTALDTGSVEYPPVLVKALENAMFFIADYLVIREVDLEEFSMIEEYATGKEDCPPFPIRTYSCKKEPAFLQKLKDLVFEEGDAAAQWNTVKLGQSLAQIAAYTRGEIDLKATFVLGPEISKKE